MAKKRRTPKHVPESALASNLARRDCFHPVREYLDSLVWDQEPRIERWLLEYAG